MSDEHDKFDLSIYDRMNNPIEAIKFLGSMIAKSRIFGCETEPQGMILAWECLVRRVAPLSLKETYHLISTKSGVSLTMRADAMLAGFIARGGQHKVIQRDADAAIVDLRTKDDAAQRFSCTMSDAEACGYNKGKDGEKDNWDSPRKKMQMLWARVISDGVRAMDPGVCSGRYVPEDFGLNADVEIPPVPSADDADVPFTVENEPGPTTTTATAAKASGSSTVTMPPTATTSTATETATAAPDEPGTITDLQRQRIEQLYEELDVKHEVRVNALKKRSANSLRNLSTQQAGLILATLEAKSRLKTIAAESSAIAGSSRLPDGATEAMLTGPCSAEQVTKAKSEIVALTQAMPGTNVSKVIKTKLVSAGLSSLSDLTMADIDRLLQSLATKNIQAWIDSELPKPLQADASAGDNSGN